MFCTICNNMYYHKLEDNNCNKLVYYCRNCGNNDHDLKDICVLKDTFNKTDNKYNVSINKYTKLDPTLPRINSIKCPNESCSSNEEDFDILNREVIYIRHDHTNMKYLYLCSHCDYTWNTEK